MVAATARPNSDGIVPFNPFQHLGQVAELMDQAFGDELGPGARYVLRRLQRMARWGGLGLLLTGGETAPLGPFGFVWLEGGQVVGNISLRRAAVPGGWMIGNVAVHADWRGQGIGRALMETAVDVATERSGSWIGLEVRENNRIARGLYEGMGFKVVGGMLELTRPAKLDWDAVSASSLPLRRAHASDSSALYRLAQEGLDRAHREALEVRPSIYRAGWDVWLAALLTGCRENWWVTEADGRIVGALRLSSRWSPRWHLMEVLVAKGRLDDLGPRLAAAGMERLSHRLPWEVTTTLPGGRQALEPTFTAAGFRRLRYLVQMRRPLRRKVTISVE